MPLDRQSGVRYRTIVADPPWQYDTTGWSYGADDPRGRSGTGGRKQTGLPYEAMSVGEITALPVVDLADPDGCHLYVWTTQRYLRDTYGIVEAWGFKPVKVLVWCKPPTGFSMGGTYGNACEFAVFARRGTLPALNKVPRDWWEWPRSGHSAKPEAFLDMVEAISPGPRLEMFARRARFGWDYWGDESLGTAEMAA